jgi:hypothetical protein
MLKFRNYSQYIRCTCMFLDSRRAANSSEHVRMLARRSLVATKETNGIGCDRQDLACAALSIATRPAGLLIHLDAGSATILPTA